MGLPVSGQNINQAQLIRWLFLEPKKIREYGDEPAIKFVASRLSSSLLWLILIIPALLCITPFAPNSSSQVILLTVLIVGWFATNHFLSYEHDENDSSVLIALVSFAGLACVSTLNFMFIQPIWGIVFLVIAPIPVVTAIILAKLLGYRHSLTIISAIAIGIALASVVYWSFFVLVFIIFGTLMELIISLVLSSYLVFTIGLALKFLPAKVKQTIQTGQPALVIQLWAIGLFVSYLMPIICQIYL